VLGVRLETKGPVLEELETVTKVQKRRLRKAIILSAAVRVQLRMMGRIGYGEAVPHGGLVACFGALWLAAKRGLLADLPLASRTSLGRVKSPASIGTFCNHPVFCEAPRSIN
jgi:hypothetical protein